MLFAMADYVGDWSTKNNAKLPSRELIGRFDIAILHLRSTNMRLVQLLLPTRDSRGSPFGADIITQTRDELISQFGGVTAYLRAVASGAWVNDRGAVDRDELVMVEVVVETFDRQWWQAYAVQLAKRFSQQEVHIRATPVEIVSGV